MQIGDGLGDAETEPVSRRLAAPLAAIEAVENLCPLLRGDADARVADERKRPPSAIPASMRTAPPAGVNLIALSIRFERASRMRSWSPRTGTGVAASTIIVTPFNSASGS